MSRSKHKSSRKKEFVNYQRKEITLEWFLRNYFVYTNDSTKLNVDTVEKRLDTFDELLSISPCSYNTHQDFLKWVDKLKSIYKNIQTINNLDEYQELVQKVIINYQTALEELSKRGESIYTRKRELSLMVTPSKSIKNNIRCLQEQLNELEMMKNNIKKILFQFECRLYAINNREVIKNIISNVKLVNEDEIYYEEVLRGQVIFVTDNKQNVKAYKNPYNLYDLKNEILNGKTKKKIYRKEENYYEKY